MRWIPAVTLISIGVALTVWTWGTWLDPMIDFGRELYVPWRLREGDVLYRDIAWFNGPLSQYLNALWFGIFGTGLRTLVACNLAILGATIVVLYGLLREIGGRMAATLGCGTGIALCGFGQVGKVGNFNWVCPYSHEITHGVALSVVCIALLRRWLAGGRRSALAGAGLVAGLVALTKPEVFVACAGSCGAGLLLGARRFGMASVVPFFAAALAPPLLALALLATAMSIGEAWHGVLGGWNYVFLAELRANLFYKTCLGLDAPLLRLETLAGWLAMWLLVLLPGVLVATFARGSTRIRWLTCATVAAATIVATLLVGRDWVHGFAPLPVAALAVLGVALARLRRHGEVTSTLLAAFSLLLLLKMPLNAKLHDYGFALGLPAAALSLTAFVGWLRPWLDARGRFGPGIVMATATFLVIAGIDHYAEFETRIRAKSKQLGRGVDAFRTGPTGPVLGEVVRHLETSPPDATVAVLPEGVMLNYLARRRTSTPYVNFVPPEQIMFGSSNIVAAFERNPPDLVVLHGRGTYEYGLPLFGRDYAVELFAWVSSRYSPVANTGFGPEPLDEKRLEDGLWGVRVLAPR